MTAHFRLNRLAVIRGRQALYDERYHAGVNIIHGDNSAGKSTIADFIFFVLGGDLRDWKEEALKADYVLAEIHAQGSSITIRRDVPRLVNGSIQGLLPMHIHFGPMDKAVEAGPTSWQMFPYKRPETGYSFSQILFRAIGVPEAISESTSNITMHQMLRILYVDQMTPIQRIFRAENFDSWEIRQAVGDLLMGVGGYSLFDRRLELREVEKEFDLLKVKLRNLMSVASGYGEEILTEFIEQGIKNAASQRAALLQQIERLLSDEEQGQADQEAITNVRREAARTLTGLKRRVADLEEAIEGLTYEIEDGREFIEHLHAKLAQFDDAAASFFALGQVQFDYCPSCFSSLREQVADHHCRLCGTDVPPEEADAKALAVRLDLEMQLSETSKLQKEREEEVRRSKADLRIEKGRLRRATEEYEAASKASPTRREAEISDLSRKVGYLDSEITNLQRRLELAQEIAHLSAEKDRLNSKISSLKSEIEALEVGQARRKAIAHTRISENAKWLLEMDMPGQNDYGDIQKVSFSFRDDWMAINGDKNRAGSASGIVVLKNSFMFSLLLSSMQDPAFNIPRFMLFDNVEDKGMLQERSWNFQNLLVTQCADRDDCQVIFTTSKISPILAGSQYVVGGKYTKQRRTLNFAN